MREKKSQATHANWERNTSITQPSINRPDTCRHNTHHLNVPIQDSMCVWWQKWAEKVSHSLKLLIWFCKRRENKSVFPVDWNGETYARTGSDCRTKSFRVYRVHTHTHTQFFLKGGTLLIRSCLWKGSAGQQQRHKQKVQQPQTLIGLQSSHGALWC